MLKQRFQRDYGLDPRKMGAKAEMDPGAEGDVRFGLRCRSSR